MVLASTEKWHHQCSVCKEGGEEVWSYKSRERRESEGECVSLPVQGVASGGGKVWSHQCRLWVEAGGEIFPPAVEEAWG